MIFHASGRVSLCPRKSGVPYGITPKGCAIAAGAMRASDGLHLMNNHTATPAPGMMKSNVITTTARQDRWRRF